MSHRADILSSLAASVDSKVNTVLKPGTVPYHMPSRAIFGVAYRYLATPR